MGGCVWFLITRFQFDSYRFLHQLGILLGVIGAGILIYVLLNSLFNREDLARLRSAFARDKILKEE
jgi:hypothetical protein